MNGQGKHIRNSFALVRGVLSRACGRVFRYKIVTMDFMSLNFKDGSAEVPAVRYLLVKQLMNAG